ncbi:hypothetical protein [Streptomyces sp. NBC_01092]|uniref:hypothetical protein n=1 Tax=Streptomyces sp. NBC_01092 TaxID=2903748 RepID=UPI0038684C3A|nr:hypothetical protein OG254_26775 [Streptomyces sp. NBC_01092]
MSGKQGGEQAPRGHTRWWLFAALVAVPALALAGFVVMVAVWVLADDDLTRSGPEKVPCADALRFGGAALPDGAKTVGACEVQGFQDIHYRATFRMPRADVPDWLTRTYPDAPAPETEFCTPDADLCLDLDAPGDHPGAGAHAVQVRVDYEDGGTALVRFTAFTM